MNDEIAAGPNINSLGTIFTLFGIAVIWYFVAKYYRKKKYNIDISKDSKKYQLINSVNTKDRYFLLEGISKI